MQLKLTAETQRHRESRKSEKQVHGGAWWTLQPIGERSKSKPAAFIFPSGSVPQCLRGSTAEFRKQEHVNEPLGKLQPCFLLSPRGTSGERIEEGILDHRAPPLPGPLLH